MSLGNAGNTVNIADLENSINKITNSEGEGGVINNLSKMIDTFNKKIDEYINREDFEGTKRMILDNMVVDLDELLEDYYTKNNVTNDDVKERNNNTIDQLFESFLILNIDPSKLYNAEAQKNQAKDNIGDRYVRLFKLFKETGVAKEMNERIIRHSLGEVDAYLHSSMITLVYNTDEDDEEISDIRELTVNNYFDSLEDVSDEVKNSITDKVSDKYSIIFLNKTVLIFEGLFLEEIKLESGIFDGVIEQNSRVQNNRVQNNRGSGVQPTEPQLDEFISNALSELGIRGVTTGSDEPIGGEGSINSIRVDDYR